VAYGDIQTTQVPSEPETETIQEVEEEVRGEQKGEEATTGEVEKKTLKSIANKRKSLERKVRKESNFLNIKDVMQDFVSLPLHKITDPKLANEVNEALKKANASTPVVD